MEFIKFIEKCLLESAEISLEKFGELEHSVKDEDPNQVLTEADLLVGEKIVNNIKSEFADHNIVDEEAGIINNDSDHTWVVDPIDGTSNFAAGSPMFGTFIGLLKENKPVAGGMVLPEFDEVYLAESGGGCFMNGNKVSVTNERKLINTLISYTIDSHREDEAKTYKETEILANIILNIRNPRMSGSLFDGAMVAKGAYGGYLNQTSKIWDNVALQVIIEEAGGVYTDFYGNKMDYSDHLIDHNRNYTYCAAAPQIHSQLQEIINSNGPKS